MFKPGHRIRLDISSSNFPRFDVNPNTGEPLNANTGWRVATNTVFHDPEHPSRIVLPVRSRHSGDRGRLSNPRPTEEWGEVGRPRRWSDG